MSPTRTKPLEIILLACNVCAKVLLPETISSAVKETKLPPALLALETLGTKRGKIRMLLKRVHLALQSLLVHH